MADFFRVQSQPGPSLAPSRDTKSNFDYLTALSKQVLVIKRAEKKYQYLFYPGNYLNQRNLSSATLVSKE